MSRGLNKKFHYDLSITRTGQGERVGVKGRDIRVTATSSAGALATVALEGEFNTTYYDMVEQAHLYEKQGFEAIYVKNDAQPGEWIELTISDGPDDFIYEKPTNNNINEILEPVMGTGGKAGENVSVSVDNIAPVVLVAANAAGTGWIIQNLGAAAIYVGVDNTVTVANGIRIDANGGHLSWDYRGDIYAISGSAGNDVRVFRSNS